MPTITVRQLDETVHRRLRERAARHGRSMEAEARAVLAEAVRDEDFADAWLAAVAPFRGEPLEIPPRSAPRPVDLP